jgi:hypothetical protein
MLNEHPINTKNNFMGGWYIDKTICTEILLNHDLYAYKYDGGTFNGVNKDIKNSTDSRLNDSPKIYQKYMSELQKAVDLYVEKYPMCAETDIWGDVEAVNVQHYKPNGGYYKWHTERNNVNNNRHLVFMTYLNDVQDAGETAFYHQDVLIKPEKGLTLIWPSDWTFTHKGIPSPTEDKYIATGWFNFIK